MTARLGDGERAAVLAGVQRLQDGAQPDLWADGRAWKAVVHMLAEDWRAGHTATAGQLVDALGLAEGQPRGARLLGIATELARHEPAARQKVLGALATLNAPGYSPEKRGRIEDLPFKRRRRPDPVTYLLGAARTIARIDTEDGTAYGEAGADNLFDAIGWFASDCALVADPAALSETLEQVRAAFADVPDPDIFQARRVDTGLNPEPSRDDAPAAHATVTRRDDRVGARADSACLPDRLRLSA